MPTTRTSVRVQGAAARASIKNLLVPLSQKYARLYIAVVSELKGCHPEPSIEYNTHRIYIPFFSFDIQTRIRVTTSDVCSRKTPVATLLERSLAPQVNDDPKRLAHAPATVL